MSGDHTAAGPGTAPLPEDELTRLARQQSGSGECLPLSECRDIWGRCRFSWTNNLDGGLSGFFRNEVGYALLQRRAARLQADLDRERARVAERDALLSALTDDSWAGWQADPWTERWYCLYCDADGPQAGSAEPPAHRGDCPIERARALLKGTGDGAHG